MSANQEWDDDVRIESPTISFNCPGTKRSNGDSVYGGRRICNEKFIDDRSVTAVE